MNNIKSGIQWPQLPKFKLNFGQSRSNNPGVPVPSAPNPPGKFAEFFGQGHDKFRVLGDVTNKYTNIDGLVEWKGMSGVLQFFHNWPMGFRSLKKAGWTKTFNQIFWNVLIFVLAFAAIYAGAISSGAISVPQEIKDKTDDNKFLQGLYFAVVTMTTLGFGDITPATVGGQILVMFHILSFFVFNFIWSIDFKPESIFG